MQNEPAKKKKKYILASNQPQTKDTSSKITLVNNQLEEKALERSRFDYTFEQIVNHLLARLLPNSNFTIKLSEKLIFGEENELDDFLNKLDQNVKYTTGITLQLNEDVSKQDIDFKMSENYRGKTFTHRLIEMSVKNFFQGTKYERDYIAFLAQFKQNEPQRLYVRLSKEYVSQFLEDIEEDAKIVENGEPQERRRRGNRTVFKNKIASLQLDADEVDINSVVKFFSRGDKIDMQDLEIKKNKDKNGHISSYTISLLAYDEDSEKKLEGFNYYFKYQDFVLLPAQECKHKSEIIKKYGKINLPSLQTEIIQGYKSSKWQDKSLCYKIRKGQISNKKTNYTSEYFEAIKLRGLLPVVRDYIDQLEKQLNEMPMDDIKEELFVDFDENIKDHIRNSKAVQIYIQEFIEAYMIQFSSICILDNVKFPLRGVKLNLTVKNNHSQSYQHIKHNLQSVMPKYISEQTITTDFDIDDEFLNKLQQQKILVIKHKKKEILYIASTQELSEKALTVQKIIREFEVISEQEINTVGLSKAMKYLQLIQNQQKTNEEYAKLLIAQPITEDKVHYKIMIYGPRKKNDKFIESIKAKIEQIERELGQYCEFIDERISKTILEDLKIQHQMQNQYNISLIVTEYQLAAKIDVCLKKNSQIFIIKSNNLDAMPINCQLYFSNKTAVLDLKEPFLQKFKNNTKKQKQDKWLEQIQKSRNYHLLFKENHQLKETFSEAAKRWKDNHSNNIVGLLMPKENKNKWITNLFDLLTQLPELDDTPFRIFIIETDSNENIEKIVDIPQYSPFATDTEQIEVEWFCETLAYNKNANNKINDAIANQLPSVMLQKQDIDNNSSTHICNLNTKTIIYYNKRSLKGLEIPFELENNEITFKYKGHILKFPPSEYSKVINHQILGFKDKIFITLPFYLIDLVNMKQTNLFTDYERPIHKKQTKITIKQQFQGSVKAYYNQKITQLIFSFQEQHSKQLIPAVSKMHSYIEQHWLKQEVKLKEVSEQQFKIILKERVEARAQEYSLKYELDPSLRSITVESFQLKDIERFKKIIENQVDYLISLSQRAVFQKAPDIQYPPNWQPQTNQIQTFEVPQNSQEFLQVKAQFGDKRAIHSLIRIQNKVIYKKYCDELEHLAHLNGQPPKEMKLFHGTGKTSADVIWADKQDGFNINYSSDTNLLGRGIYFAEKSQYSLGYKSIEGFYNNQHLHGMLLCSVIVGDSQQMNMSQVNRNVLDTNFKPNGIRFESMKGKHTVCDIYVVYKNRRAYPLYLIKFL